MTARGFNTTDLCDEHGDQVRAAQPIFRRFGANAHYNGAIVTLLVFEDNALVRATVSQPGAGRVLVVDGGGSLNCALVGDQLALLAVQNSWSGIIVNGCIRDSVAVDALAIGVRALAIHPRRSHRSGAGTGDIPVSFAGVTFNPGEFVYVDEDGIVVSARALI